MPKMHIVTIRLTDNKGKIENFSSLVNIGIDAKKRPFFLVMFCTVSDADLNQITFPGWLYLQ